MSEIELAVIGGSGLYNMAGLADVKEVELDTPFGPPSDTIIVGALHGRRVAFLPRHGRGLVAHVTAAQPFCAHLSAALADATQAAGGRLHRGGAFITVEGPRFSTRGESEVFRQWGMSIIGMTTSPEAFLAAEAEISYACMAHITDYDVWHHSEAPVTVEMVVRVLQANTRLAQEAISVLIATYDQWAGDFPAHSAMKDALITDPRHAPASVRNALRPLIGNYLPE